MTESIEPIHPIPGPGLSAHCSRDLFSVGSGEIVFPAAGALNSWGLMHMQHCDRTCPWITASSFGKPDSPFLNPGHYTYPCWNTAIKPEHGHRASVRSFEDSSFIGVDESLFPVLIDI